MTPEQNAEIGKYDIAYRDPHYRMGERRKAAATHMLSLVPPEERVAYLDVATGRGEMLRIAREMGWGTTRGTEVVQALLNPLENVRWAPCWDIPYPGECFDTVTCLDVMEHLLPEDTEPTVRELVRVSSKWVFLTISNRSGRHAGLELHINKRPYEDWDRDLRAWTPGWEVQRLPDCSTPVSECWMLRRSWVDPRQG